MLPADNQNPYEYFVPETRYAPVAVHESIRLFIAFCEALNLRIEEADVDNAYLYGTVYVPIVMEQPTSSTVVVKKPNHVCELATSLYGPKQSGMLWRSLLDKTLPY